MEKKKTPDKKEVRQAGKKAQNPAQQLAKQRLQRDMQKKLLDTRKKAKEQEQEQTPEADAVTRLEQLAEQIFPTPSIHSAKKGKSGKASPASSQETHLPDMTYNAKMSYRQAAPVRSVGIKSEPRFTKAQNMVANPAMKRWVHQRMILQKQKMRINTKVKMQMSFVHHAQPETTAEQLLRSGGRPSNITTQLLKAPINLYAPNTAWAHTVIQKKQTEFRQKYLLLKNNPKKETHGTEQAQKLPAKWTAQLPVNQDTMEYHYPIAQSKQISESVPTINNLMKSVGIPPASYPRPIPHRPIPPYQQQTRPADLQQAKQQSKQSSVCHKQHQAQLVKNWQAKQRQQRHHIAHSPRFYTSGRNSGRNIWNQVQAIAVKVQQVTKHAGAWGITLIVLLMFLLLFGAVSGLVTSPFGVFFSSQETSPDARSVRAAIAETNNEYFNRLDDLIRNTAHDTLIIKQIPIQQAANETRIQNWEEILAVFAVQTTTNSQAAMDVVKLDDKRIQNLKDIFWQMVSIEHKIQTTGSNDKKKTTLTITITTKSAEQMSDELHFSKVQKGALDELLANRLWLTELVGQATGSGSGHGGGEYQVPPEALEDEKFKAMITEAEKYLGYPYVWGGSSPSTSFDCSGFVSWVINKSGVGNVGRQTAQGLYDLCTPISKAQAKPGDLVFFTKTYNSAGPVSHIGIFVGDGKMIHCGDPIQYTSIETSYWQKHFYSFGRI